MKRVVLVRPGGPRNVGMIVRETANFGPCELVLVAPELPSLLVHPEFQQMSHGVPEARERCRVVATLEEALADCTFSVGFTARPQEGRPRHEWRAKRDELGARGADPDERVALVFGAEVGGLRSDEVARCAELVFVPTSAEHTSLNLAVAVGVVLADLFAERRYVPRERGVKPLTNEARAFLVANLKHAFGERVALTESARRDIEDSIDRVFGRGALEDRDARAWHLMARALGSTLTPKALGLEITTKRARHRALQDAARAKPRVLFAGGSAEWRARARSQAAQMGFTVASAGDDAELRAELERDTPASVVLDADANGLAEVVRALAPTARIAPRPEDGALGALLASFLACEDDSSPSP
ncbi:MAG: RNA methyltransferase [Planctomycetota bacterium]